MENASIFVRGQMGHAGHIEKPYVFVSPMRPLQYVIKGTLLIRVIILSLTVPLTSPAVTLHKHRILAVSHVSPLSLGQNSYPPENYRR